MKDIHDVITQAKFGDNRLRGSGVVAGQISAFPIDFAGRPYNTLTLPCERVIKRFRAAVSVFVGPCCPALLNCVDVDVHTVALLGKQNDDDDDRNAPNNLR